MAVYIDRMAAPFGRMKMCHMLADSTAELLAMADCIGVARRWLQHGGEYREHFDICLSKRALALRAGAIEVSARDVGRMILARRLVRDRAEVLI